MGDSIWTTADSVCWDFARSYEVTSIWVTVSSTWGSDGVSLSNGIEDIERGKSQAKAPIKSHYGPVWWTRRSAGHLMTTTGTRCPVCCRGALPVGIKALHVATPEKLHLASGHKPQFIWLSLKRTNNVARWYKITRSIMVIIMPFIKIGQLSQHLALIGGDLVGEGLGSVLYPTYFPLSFIKACCQWFDEAK